MTTAREWNEFANKMDWEGGMYDVLEYGGVDIFPEEAREAATAFQEAAGVLRAILDEHGAFDPKEIDESDEDEAPEPEAVAEQVREGEVGLRRKSDRPES
jgi:hypothetical protein